jgi:hypothetical protein
MVVYPQTEYGRGEPRPSLMATSEYNPPRGFKSEFRKLTMTLPPDAYRRLVEESARRKIAGESNSLLSALLREAVAAYLERLPQSEEND